MVRSTSLDWRPKDPKAEGGSWGKFFIVKYAISRRTKAADVIRVWLGSSAEKGRRAMQLHLPCSAIRGDRERAASPGLAILRAKPKAALPCPALH